MKLDNSILPLLFLVGCSGAQGLPANTVCQLNAITTLPSDFRSIQVRDVEALVKELQGCKLLVREVPADAGVK